MKTAAYVFLAFLVQTPAAASALHSETRIAVSVPQSEPGKVSGRLLIFARPASAENANLDHIEIDPAAPSETWVAARDVLGVDAHREMSIDTAETAFPASFETMVPGDYRIQALLDRNGDYNNRGPGPGDLVSKVMTIRLPVTTVPHIPLDRTLPEVGLWDFPGLPATVLARFEQVRPHLHDVTYRSEVLSAFWGRPIRLSVWVLTPPGYDNKKRLTWPTAYVFGGFNANRHWNIGNASNMWRMEVAGTAPSMIWVFLDYSSLGTGATEFADSVNNGPWGEALTKELIPLLERRYRMDARPSGRLLTGHSSGGWASLWAQVRYPTLFGGTWSTAPDASDFHAFSGADLYAADANLYYDSSGKARPLMRGPDGVIVTTRDYARIEAITGHDGGQFRSFEWVFSPRGADGRPMAMFDRETGAVDPDVAAHWRDHFDIARRIETRWPMLRRDLNGKIRLIVGTEDSFYLDEPAHQLEAALKRVGASGSVSYVDGKTHYDLYSRGDDHFALSKDIAWAMYQTARPGRPAGKRPLALISPHDAPTAGPRRNAP